MQLARLTEFKTIQRVAERLPKPDTAVEDRNSPNETLREYELLEKLISKGNEIIVTWSRKARQKAGGAFGDQAPAAPVYVPQIVDVATPSKFMMLSTTAKARLERQVSPALWNQAALMASCC